VLAFIWSATPWASPATALTAGIAFGVTLRHPFRAKTQKISKILLQACVVALGFGMSLSEIVRVGRSGFVYTLLGITFSLFVGVLLGKILRVNGTNAFLVSVGTAICGGSAIAAVGRVIDANDEQMAVSLGTVFILNAVGLMAFPLIGAHFGLTQRQFGLWAALAIHDTSSVVGAGEKYGAVALAVATTVKLARALWILPISAVTAAVKRSQARVQFPWFILFFTLAAVINTYALRDAATCRDFANLGKNGLTVTLFLIGSGISRSTLKKVGVRPLVQGLCLWIMVASLSLWLIRWGILSL
jgi:uncharacterized integral membrane protein (TIGR00698 family)